MPRKYINSEQKTLEENDTHGVKSITWKSNGYLYYFVVDCIIIDIIGNIINIFKYLILLDVKYI